MRRYELSDPQWSLMRDLMPPSGGPGHPWNDHRETLNAMLWILHTGAPWRDLPEHYPPWQSVYDRFNFWRKDGTFDLILRRLQIKLDEEGKIDWDLWTVDGTSVRASRSAAGAGKKGVRRSPKTTRWGAREAGTGPRSTWLLAVTEWPSEPT